MAKTRVAVAGAGMIGRAHIALARVSPTVALSAVVDPMPQAQDLAREAGVPWYRSLAELFDQDRPDGVVVATPNQLHRENALECMAIGMPMLLEKPVTDSVASSEELLAAAAGSPAPILVGHHRTHSGVMTAAKRVVADGTLGRLVGVTGTALFFKPDSYYAEGPWRSQPGGGPVMLNMIHEVHSLRILCGEIESVQACASSSTRGFAVEDTASVILTFVNGALGSFLISDTAASAKSWEQTSQENLSYVTYPDEDCYHVVGTAGSLSVPTMRLKTYARPEVSSWWEPLDESVLPVERTDPLKVQLEHFGAVARGEVEPLVTLADGVQNVRVVDAIARSARAGRAVDVTQ